MEKCYYRILRTWLTQFSVPCFLLQILFSVWNGFIQFFKLVLIFLYIMCICECLHVYTCTTWERRGGEKRLDPYGYWELNSDPLHEFLSTEPSLQSPPKSLVFYGACDADKDIPRSQVKSWKQCKKGKRGKKERKTNATEAVILPSASMSSPIF